MKRKDRQSPGTLGQRSSTNPTASTRTTGRGAQRPAGGRVGAEPGAESSNTAPDNCNPGYFKPLRWGVDSLYLSYQGKLYPEIDDRLKALKKLAQSPEADQQSLAQYPIDGHIFEVKDRGAALFPYVVNDGAFRIQLSRSKALPMAYVKISAGYLAHVGPEKAEAKVASLLAHFGGLSSFAQVSRIDLFVDFVSFEDMESWDREAWVTRAARINSYSVDGRFSGWAIGLGGIMSARLYDKVLEIKTSGKTYLYELWKAAGRRDDDPVWRLEFEIKRQTLGQFGLVFFADVLRHRNGLWDYATTKWLRLCIPNPDDDTRTRWPIHPLWGYLSSIDWETDGGSLLRAHDAVRVPGDEKLFSMYLASLIAYMSREGIGDLYQGQDAMTAAVVAYYSDKAYRMGQSFDDYIAERVAVKARLFNTLVNDPEAEDRAKADSLAARAAAYRREADGQ